MQGATLLQKKLLEKIESITREDSRIIGLWVVGSMATGNADKYSDLDVYILIEKENYDKVFGERSSFAEKIGKILCSFEVEWPNCQLYGVILENCVEVDLCYCKPEQLEIFDPYKILVDIKGDLKELLSQRTVEFKVNVRERLAEHLDFAAYNLLHAINMLGRGEYWSSIRQVETLRKRIISLIGLRSHHTDVDEEYRRLEHLINEKENKVLQKTLCNYTFESVENAIRIATSLFVQEAEKLCTMHVMQFPSERFERLLEYLNEVSLEKHLH